MKCSRRDVPSDAIVLAGGLGTRLRGVLPDLPKSLAPVGGRPFLTYLLDRLQRQGFRRVALATGYLADAVAQAIGDRWGDMRVLYSREDAPLGTGGAIRAALSLADAEYVHVFNGDTYVELDSVKFQQYVIASGAPVGMALAKVPDAQRYGTVRLEGGMAWEFIEKGRSGPAWINAGVYCLRRDIAQAFPAAENFSFEQDFLAGATQRGTVAAYCATSAFIDIGIPQDYARAADILMPTPSR